VFSAPYKVEKGGHIACREENEITSEYHLKYTWKETTPSTET
jgi:hypothetical protein